MRERTARWITSGFKRQRKFGSLALAVLIFAGVSSCVPEEEGPADPNSYVAGEILVRFDEGVIASPGVVLSESASSKLSASSVLASATPQRAVATVSSVQQLNETWVSMIKPVFTPIADHPTLRDIYHLALQDKDSTEAALAAYRKDPNVEYASLNFRVKAHGLPNDPYVSTPQGTWSSGSWNQTYRDLWGLEKIQAHKAWSVHPKDEQTRGEIVVAVIDTGFDPTHPDIAENIWINPCEDQDPIGIVDEADFNDIDDACPDERGNGIVDDVSGWSFLPTLPSHASAAGDYIVWQEEKDGSDIVLYNRRTHTRYPITQDQEYDLHPTIVSDASGTLIVWERGPVPFDFFGPRRFTGGLYACVFNPQTGECPAQKIAQTDWKLSEFITGVTEKKHAVSGKRIVWVESEPLNLFLGGTYDDLWVCDFNFNTLTCPPKQLTHHPSDQPIQISWMAVSGNRIVWDQFLWGVYAGGSNFSIYQCLYNGSTCTSPQLMAQGNTYHVSLAGDLLAYKCSGGICLHNLANGQTLTLQGTLDWPMVLEVQKQLRVIWHRGIFPFPWTDPPTSTIPPPNDFFGFSTCVYDRSNNRCPEERLTENGFFPQWWASFSNNQLFWTQGHWGSNEIYGLLNGELHALTLATRVEEPLTETDDFGDRNALDFSGHGTHVSGTIAAVGNNNEGVIGVAPRTKIMPLQVLDSLGYGTWYWVAQAIVYAAANGADVINLSLGCAGNCPKNPLAEDAVRFAYQPRPSLNKPGAIIVVSAGNSTQDVEKISPQNMTNPKPIVVAATDPEGHPAYFSNFGYEVDVAAPGVDILSLRARDTLWPTTNFVPSNDPNAKYLRLSGTSMAAPHVSGLAALVLAHNPVLQTDPQGENAPLNDKIRQHIINTGAGHLVWNHRQYGHGGVINVQKALAFPTNRIAAHCGFVNQHTEDGDWMTDPNGTSGCNLIPGLSNSANYQQTLAYCRVFYPTTHEVENFATETIYDWKGPGNQGRFTETVQTYECVTDAPPHVNPPANGIYYKVQFLGGSVPFSITADSPDGDPLHFSATYSVGNKTGPVEELGASFYQIGENNIAIFFWIPQPQHTGHTYTIHITATEDTPRQRSDTLDVKICVDFSGQCPP